MKAMQQQKETNFGMTFNEMRNLVIIVGDFNARMGTDTTEKLGVMGILTLKCLE